MHITTKLDYRLVTQETEQELKLLIRLQAPVGTARKRKPLNLGVVIDRSGSMSGEKLACTKRALRTLITHLGPDDCLSLVQFDDDVQVVLEPTPVRDKDALKHLVDRIDTGGSTNLSAGWLQGLKLVGQQADRDCISRCLLLTDGQANVGIQDDQKLAFIGRSARQQWNIVTTTLGFGEGFNEDLLSLLAREAGGAFYYVEQPEQAPAIFNEELQGLLRLVAQNIEVILQPGAAVKMVAQWTDYPVRPRPGAFTFSLGDAYAEEEKNLLVSLMVPGCRHLGQVAVAQLAVTYAALGDAGARTELFRHTVAVNVAEAELAEQEKPDEAVQQQYGLQLAARARKQAMAEADGGDYHRAKRTLRQAMETLGQMPDPGHLLREEVEELAQQAEQMEASRYAGSRKVMRETVQNAALGNYARVRSARARRQGKAGGTQDTADAPPAESARR